MYKYIESVSGYNFAKHEFQRFGKTEWRIYYTAKAIIVNGRYLPVYHDMEWAYKIRKDGLYTMYDNAKDFVKHFFHDKLSIEAWQENICHRVYKLGRQVKGMQKQTLWYATNDTPFDMRPYESVCQSLGQAMLLTSLWGDDYKEHGYSFEENNNLTKGRATTTYFKGNEKHKVSIKAI